MGRSHFLFNLFIFISDIKVTRGKSDQAVKTIINKKPVIICIEYFIIILNFQVKFCIRRKNVEKITKLNMEKLLSNYHRAFDPIATYTIKITTPISCYFNKPAIHFDR